ncbi:MAG: hypothetical protein ACW986_11110 [Promethearchaeota archaeon]|jgi:molybdopterin converting factor small subunit
MHINLKVFGDLRKKVNPQVSGTIPLKLNINDVNIAKVIDILNKLGIEEEEVSHIFVNGSYSGTRKSINNGDVVALFPRNMGLLYKWYFSKDED